MTIFNITDLHGSLRRLPEVRREAADADVIVVSGDITNFAGREEARRIIDELSAVNPEILAVSGNCDRAPVEGYLRERGIALHAAVLVHSGVAFAGLGGSLPGPGPTPNTYSEEELAGFLDSIDAPPGAPLVLVSHQPPFDTPADRIAAGRHAGSRSVRSYIERVHPVLCLSGHIHESVGQGDLAGCRVVNPGPFGQGRYALIELDARGGVGVEMHVK